MESMTFTWSDLCTNAAYFHLDMQEFVYLKVFYDRMDKAFFSRCVSQMFQTFPWDEVRQSMSESEMREFLLLCIITGYNHLEQLYRDNGYPKTMFEEISTDLRTWLDTLLRDFDGYGLTTRVFGWECECLTGCVKSFGRLQGNDIHSFYPSISIYRKIDGTLETRPAFTKGNPPNPMLTQKDKTINIHIPAKGPLDELECVRSIRRMCDFSATFHPDYDYKAIVCYSWLLDSKFQQLLSPKSNIVRFQRLGHNLSLSGEDQTQEVRWRIWGTKCLNFSPEELPIRNSMERSVASFLSEGGRFQEGLLVIFRDELPDLFKRT